jgi:Flp pilus assembly protein CpaB
MELTGKKYVKRDWRRVLATRRGTVLVAVACALVAAGVLVYAMSKYRSSVDASGNPETVYVATRAIPKNTSGDAIAAQGMFKPTEILARQVTAGAIVDASLMRGKVAARDINPGEQLTAADFTASPGLPAQLAPAQRAMTLTLDAEHGMLGLVNTGDHVDVYAGVQLDSLGGRTTVELRRLLSNVVVLKAGASASSGVGASSSNSTSQVTLNVPDSAAGAIAFAADNGKIWLALRPPNATSTPQPPAVTVQSLLLGSKALSNGGQS